MRIFMLCFFIWRVICEEVKSPAVKQGTVCLDCQKAPIVNLACGLKEKIAFNGIYYGAKKDESCKRGTKFDCETAIPSCCSPSRINGDDCTSTVDKDAYYTKCIGLQRCTIEFSNDQMTCDKAETQPNYAGVSYVCIPENKNFVFLEQDSKAKSTIVYLMNSNYPSAVGDYSVITCSVETLCGKMLNINAFDMYFGHKEGSGCAQELSITDLTKTYKKTCFQNNNFRKIRYFVSNKNFLILTFENKIKSETSYVWLEISEYSQREEVEVICGTEARTRPNSCEPLIDRFKQQGNPVTITTETGPSIPVNTTDELKTGKSVAVEDNSHVKVVTLSLVLILLLVLGIVFGIYFYKKKKQLKITPDSEEDEVVVSAHSDTEPIDSRPPVSTRNEENTPDPSTSDGRSRRRNIIPPLPNYPALLSRHNKILPTLEDVTSCGQLPRDNRKTLPKIRPRIQRRDSSDYEYE